MMAEPDGLSEVPPPSIPPHFTADIFDYVLFYSDEDEEDAENFVEAVDTEAKRLGRMIRGILYTDPTFNQGSGLDNIQNIFSITVQAWLFVTDRFVKNPIMQGITDEHWHISRLCKDRKYSLVPIWTKPKEEFEDIPFGIYSIVGYQRSDSRLVKKILARFDTDDHRAKKADLRMKQQQKKGHHVAEAKKRQEKHVQWQEKQHEERMAGIEAEDGDAAFHQMIQRKLHNIQERLRMRGRQTVAPESLDSSVESAIPSHLSEHLLSLRARVTPPQTVYYVTINSPQHIDFSRAGEPDTVFKNAAADAGNPSMENGEPKSNGSQARGGGPVKETDSDSSFDVV